MHKGCSQGFSEEALIEFVTDLHHRPSLSVVVAWLEVYQRLVFQPLGGNRVRTELLLSLPE